MDYSKLINDSGVYLYQDDSFNTINMQLCFWGKRGNREDAINYLLCQYMTKSNQKNISMGKKMRELYSIDIIMSTQKIGMTSNIVLCADMVSPAAIKDNYLDKAFEFISDILLYPDFTNEHLLETIKRTYISKIMHHISNPSKRADRLQKDSAFGEEYNKYDNSIDPDYISDTINSITLEDLEKAYNEYINEEHFYRGIVLGNISMDEFKLFRKYVSYKNNKPNVVYSCSDEIIDNDIEVIDSETNESILYLTYEINGLDEALFRILYEILNGSNGLCFQILREKYGLVYSSSALIYSFRNAIVFKAKIDKENKQKAIDAIKEVVSILQDKTKLKELLQFAKESLKNDAYLLTENKSDLFDHLDDYVRGILGDFDYFEFIKNIDSYSEDDIIKHTKSLKQRNIFIYRGDKNA